MNRPASPAARTGVIIVDDDPLVRQALARFVGSAHDLVVLGSARDGSEGVALVERVAPQVVLMDVQMPAVDGVAATRALRATHPDVRVLVLTAFADHETVTAALRAGASGFLNKTARPHEVVQAIRLVARGHSVLPAAEVARQWAGTPGDPPAGPADEAANLTPRETEVLAVLARGLSNREIAAELHLSESTVKMHLSSVMAKLGVTSRVQVLVRAHQLGLGQAAPGTPT
ncbi:MAG: response regulator transcription factor [Propionicimonas sp.]